MSNEIVFLKGKIFDKSVKLQFESSNLFAFGFFWYKFSNNFIFSEVDKSMLFNVILLPEFERKFDKFEFKDINI